MKTAILIPCLNEEQTVARVIRDFRKELPDADIHVFDNASTDNTVQEAFAAGASVHRECRRGKGFVVQSMFRAVEADIYVMVDGDDTYPAPEVHELVRPIAEGKADMVVGSRFLAEASEFHALNLAGNKLFLGMVNVLFGARLTDMLSGYRAMSRRFVKGLPLVVPGFEIETELSIKAVERGFRIVEVPTRLRKRPEGSFSKLRRFHDGVRILRTILALVRDYRPLLVFGGAGAVLGALTAATALFNGSPLLVMGTLTAAIGSTLAGLIVNTVSRRLREVEVLSRLAAPDERLAEVENATSKAA
ncbi:MAG: glycosyltransferase [Planctomycetes bacterium]|nr:glycosyltransferase [Planctomycetota bacterium]